MGALRTGWQAITSIPRLNAQEWAALALPIRWLIATRASVLFMTLMSGALGGFLALRDGNAQLLPFLLCLLGLLAA